MKIISILRLPALVLGIIILASCSHEPVGIESKVIETTAKIIDYVEALDPNQNIMTVVMQSHRGNATQFDLNSYISSKNELKVSNYSLHFNKTPLKNGNFSKFYSVIGNKTPIPFNPGEINYFTITKNNSGKQTEEQLQMYYPEPIAISNEADFTHIDRNQDLVVEWEVDVNNDKPIGLAVIARNFLSEEDLAELENINLDDIENFDSAILSETIDDDGSYTIPSALLAQIPAGMEIDVVLARGNFETLDDYTVYLGNADFVTSEFSN